MSPTKINLDTQVAINISTMWWLGTRVAKRWEKETRSRIRKKRSRKWEKWGKRSKRWSWSVRLSTCSCQKSWFSAGESLSWEKGKFQTIDQQVLKSFPKSLIVWEIIYRSHSLTTVHCNAVVDCFLECVRCVAERKFSWSFINDQHFCSDWS